MASNGSFNTGGYDGRCLNFSWSVASQSIANNTTTINWTLKGAGGNSSVWYQAGNFKVIIDGVQRYFSANRIQLRNGTVVASGTVTLSHDSVGNKSFSAYAEAGIYTIAVNCSGSGSWTLPTIPRQANITAADNFNDTGNPKITYSNPAGNNVTSLQACIANSAGTVIYAAYRNISKTGSSYTFNLTTAERNALRQACANSKTLAVKFYVTTVIGGNTYYSTLDRTMTVVDANPTFSSSYADTNPTTLAITNNNQKLIRYQSWLEVYVTNLSAKKSATIKSAKCTLNGTTYNGYVSSSSTSTTIYIGAVSVSSNTTATITVTDSRGFSTTSNITLQVLNWWTPSAIITMQRQNNFYSDTSINVDGNIASLDNLNAMTIQMRYKKVSDSAWSSYVTMQDNVAQTFDLDNTSEWNIQVLISDKIGSTTYNLILSRGMPIQFWDTKKSSVGFNRFPTHEGAVEGVLPIVLYDNASGSSGNITLNETAANFEYIEIFYKSNDNEYSSVKVADPNGKTVTLMNVHPNASNVAYFKSTTVQISGTSISPVSYSEFGISASGTTLNVINHNLITKVVGVV